MIDAVPKDPSATAYRRRTLNHDRGTTTVIRVVESRLGEELDPALFTPKGIAGMQPEHVTQLLTGYDFEITFADE